ncbi:hypothetical protein V8E51_002449 [Hyaloscypha variabilis]
MTMSQNATAFLESEVSSTRTVFDILWSCLFTIFACTWTVQHLNVPPQREECGIKPGWKGDFKYAVKNFWTSATWMIITILAPEVLVMINAGQLEVALDTVDELKKFAEEDGVPWSLTHSLFANMGGFVLREFEPERRRSSSILRCQDIKGEMEKKDPETPNDSVEVVLPGGGAALASGGLDPSSQVRRESRVKGAEVEELKNGQKKIHIDNGPLSGKQDVTHTQLEANQGKKPRTFFILAHEILKLREKGIIQLPYITKDEIMDKGNTDNFARILAICQTLWLVVQMIVRASQHLEVTQYVKKKID